MTYPPELRRMAELTAAAVDMDLDVDRRKVIADAVEGDLKRAYDMGRAHEAAAEARRQDRENLR